MPAAIKYEPEDRELRNAADNEFAARIKAIDSNAKYYRGDRVTMTSNIYPSVHPETRGTVMRTNHYYNLYIVYFGDDDYIQCHCTDIEKVIVPSMGHDSAMEVSLNE